MILRRLRLLAFLFPLLLLAVRPVDACACSIPVVGQWPGLRIGLEVPSSPRWAHDLILNASEAWNLAQLWFQENYSPGANVYSFFDSPVGNVTISFAIPAAFASIAVGWTEYVLQASSTILSAHVFLDGSIFNATEAPNVTMQEYGFRIVLHELGRVLGLGSVMDGLDIMDPIQTLTSASVPPLISLIDLFALHVLASTPSPPSAGITLNTDQSFFLNAWNITGLPFGEQSHNGLKVCMNHDDRFTGC